MHWTSLFRIVNKPRNRQPKERRAKKRTNCQLGLECLEGASC